MELGKSTFMQLDPPDAECTQLRDHFQGLYEKVVIGLLKATKQAESATTSEIEKLKNEHQVNHSNEKKRAEAAIEESKKLQKNHDTILNELNELRN